MQATQERVPVKFTKSAPPYTKDEVAWFPRAQATTIQDRGLGLVISKDEIPKPPKPEPEEPRVRVQFTRSHPPYTENEHGTFVKSYAEKLVRGGVARLAPLSAAEVAEREKNEKERADLAAKPGVPKLVREMTTDQLEQFITNTVKAVLGKAK